MITDLLLSIFFVAAEAVVGLLPAEGSIGAPDLSGISTAVGIGKAFDAGLPISETITIIHAYLIWLVGLFAIGITVRIWKMLPFT